MTLQVEHKSIAAEISDFLAEQPSVEAIIAYKASPEVQARIDHLLDRNSEGTITSDELRELQDAIAVADLMDLLMLKLRLKQKRANK